ncbi:MAG: ATP-binding protein [Thermodesulfobacteriota bacterium]
MTQQELEKLLNDLRALPKECEWAEFKVNNRNPQEIGEYLSALSNSACYHHQKYGFLAFGIEDETHRLVGTSFRPLYEKKGNQEVENWLATQLNPRIDFNIFEFDHNGLHFAVFRVDAAVNMPVSFRGVPYIRIGSYKKRLDNHPERERKIWDRTARMVFEKEPAAEKVSEEDVLRLIDYPDYFDMMKLLLPDNRKGIIERLLQDKIIEPSGHVFNITNLGGILFAKNIEQFETIARKAVRVIVYQGINRIKTKKEQGGTKGYAIGFEGLIKYITDQLPTNEVLEKALRKEVSVYSSLAIRELVANAIIHQDFSIKGTSPMVEIFDNRIEITNPGKPLIDPLRFVDHSPESRNELLARFMRRLNICEERGSGIDKVVFECEYYQLPAPEFIVGDNFTRTTLYAPLSLRQMDKKDKIRACYLHACLKYVSGEMMTNQSLRKRFGIDEQNYPMASRIIADTTDAKLIKDYDPASKSKKYAKYLPFWA